MTKKKNRKILAFSGIIFILSFSIFLISIKIESKILFNFSTAVGFLSFSIFLFLGLFPAGVNFFREIGDSGPFGAKAEDGIIGFFIFEEDEKKE